MASDRLTRLTELRDAQEAALGEPMTARDFAALSREYRTTLAELDELTPKAAEGDVIDEIAARRGARRSGSRQDPARSKRPG